ncbi:C-type lectin domain family 4 member M-like [Gadus chalcogrammus]|uniref:C-type lectin domain family 4 member M-like n=1 Tax=Gadus chalcogrammus TaxID=1042646 RepID=UPI0024C47549|nr:C-type lectin domain family 4 member M-like [Gadus chalcogrammus]
MFHDESVYLISTTKKNWTASREDCLQRNADLVVINSREEQEQIFRFVSRLMGTSWLGLSDRDTEGTFKWVDGTPMTSSWRHGKPRVDGGAKYCVVAGEDGWSEEPCDRQHYWICEKAIHLDHLRAGRNKEANNLASHQTESNNFTGSAMPTEEEEEGPWRGTAQTTNQRPGWRGGSSS